MNILFYRYNSICEPDIIAAFTELGHTVKTIDVEITNKDIDGKEVVEIVSSALLSEHFDGVLSINYYPVISAVCNIFKTLYISWTVDSPVVELLSDTVKNPYNRIFCLIMRSIRIYHHIILTVFSTYLWQPTADTGIA